MDTFNTVIHDNAWKEDIEDIPEMTRVAFRNLFNDSTDSKLVALWLVERCRWHDLTETNDGIMEGKKNALRNVIIGVINELNRAPIVNEQMNEEA